MARSGWSTTVRGGKKLAALAARARRAQAQPVEIEVGVFESARYPTGQSAAFIGAIHEFGAPRANIPERPWFRSALPDIQDAVQKLVRKHIDPRNPIMSQRIADLIGATAVGILQRSITELDSPPLAESTIRTKMQQGKRPPYNVLLDTGFLRMSISWVVR